MEKKMNREKLVKFLTSVLTDAVIVFLVVWAIHYLFYYPTAWFVLVMIFCIAVRYEDVYDRGD